MEVIGQGTTVCIDHTEERIVFIRMEGMRSRQNAIHLEKSTRLNDFEPPIKPSLTRQHPVNVWGLRMI